MHTPLRSLVAAVSVAAFAFSAPVSAQQKVKIGFISTFSGPQGVMGQFMKESVELAIDHLGGKVGGLPVEMFYGDDLLTDDGLTSEEHTSELQSLRHLLCRLLPDKRNITGLLR